MKPARWPRTNPSEGKLMVVHVGSREIEQATVRELPEFLSPADLLVVNDAATAPASIQCNVRGESVEIRLVGRDADGTWQAVLFGAGDWHLPTENRPPPPRVGVGDTVQLAAMTARIEDVSPRSPRLVRVRFNLEDEAFWVWLYRSGRPIQYSYLAAPLDVWHVQTSYAARPWSVEAPSAGFALTGELLVALRKRGVAFASITHAAGLSSTGDAELDALLPLTERSDVPSHTIDAIEETRAKGGRIIAVGTTVVRALEGRAVEGGGVLRPGEGTTSLRLGPGYKCLMVKGLLTGMHDPTASHFALMQAFAPQTLLEQANAMAEKWEFLGHEFGDMCLLL